MRNWLIVLGLVFTAGGCTASTDADQAAAEHGIMPAAETVPTSQSDANAAVLIPDANGDGVIVGTSESGGLEVYGLDGTRRSAIPAGEPIGIDARQGVPDGNASQWLLAVLDSKEQRLRFFAFDAVTGKAAERTARALPIGFAGESLCLYRDARDGTLYAFALGAAGEIGQYVVFGNGDRVDARLVRQMHVASETSYCAADDATGDLYVAEQGVGLWRFNADPETETVPQLIDAVRIGRITREVGGVAVYDGGAANYLVVSDASGNRFHVYDRNADHKYVGSFVLKASPTIDAVEGAGGLYATSLPYGSRFPRGALLAMDDENDGGTNYKLVSWADIAAALKLPAGTPKDPRTRPRPPIASVRPAIETPPVETDGDSADDPAIWVDRANPSRSVIIGTQKQSGLYVYDLAGQVLQFLPDGRMNNVDLRNDFRLGGQNVTLVTASNRTNDSIAIYRFDPSSRQLIAVADGIQSTGFVDPYGLCMYRSARSGRTYVFVNDTEGAMKQWELVDAGNGRVRANAVRQFKFDSQAEGCVADDETGILYVAEEDAGLWRMQAEPGPGNNTQRVAVAMIRDNKALADDLEGVGLYALAGGRGYIVVSSQGNNTYAIFRREGNNEYVGSFAVVADHARGIDGISETDGLDVTSAGLGGPYAQGIFVAQDGRNVAPPANQNFKIVPWSDIATALHLSTR